jgi:malate synthase
MSAIELLGRRGERHDEVLTPDALAFLARLHDRFAGPRHERLAARMRRRRDIDNGRDLRFLDDTADVRSDTSWKVAGAGPGLEDRRVEITGPTDRKMTVNALNSGANVWLADHEDAMSPTWENVIGGQVNLSDAIRRRIGFTTVDPDTGAAKSYAVTEGPLPTIVFRPRGWHLVEKHLRYRNATGIASPASASLVDFGLYFFHNAAELIATGTGPYFYLPKLESHLEARLWDEVFAFAEGELGIPPGTIRATLLIETIPAAFEMDEILYELRDHCAGLNAGRWDYIFSIIKAFRSRGRRFVLPDRKHITKTVPFMRAYTELLVSTCHRRGAYAIGGMSAFIPNRRDPEVTARALEQVAADKRREAADGFDGTWVAHPDLIPTARAEFDRAFGAGAENATNQLHRTRSEVQVTAAQLLDIGWAGGQVTEAGVADNIGIALRYIEAWLRGIGAVAIDNLMEDAATAEISRSQVWQWVNENTVTAEGRRIDAEWAHSVLTQVTAGLDRFDGDRFDDAIEVFTSVALEPEFPAFLTVGAYARYF